MRSDTRRRCRLAVESLEGREVPAGAVTTSLIGGNLTITGDNLDNQITISQATVGQVTIVGGGTTTVDGGASSTKSFTGNLAIKLLHGNDTVSFDLTNPIVLPLGLSVFYGASGIGTKVTQTTNATTNTLSVAKNLTINYGAGTVTTTLDNLRVNGNVTVSHGDGDSAFTADSKAAASTFAVIGGNLTVRNKLGQAMNFLADTNVGKNVNFSNGKAVTTIAGSTTIANVVNTTLATIQGNLTISNTSGDSTGGGDSVGDVHVMGNATLSLGNGAFKATLANVKGASPMVIDGKLTVSGTVNGTDTISLGAPVVGLTVGKNLKIKAGSHSATISIDDTAVNGNTNITTGNDADTVTIDGNATDEGSTFSGNFNLSTGQGIDSLSINSGAVASTALTDFELGVSVNLGADNDTLTLATAGIVNFFAPVKTPVVFDGGVGIGDTNTLTQTAANVQGTHGAPTFKHFI